VRPLPTEWPQIERGGRSTIVPFEPYMRKPLAVGLTAEIYFWEEGWVLKLFKEGFSKAEVREEARLTEAARRADLPVPAVGEVLEVSGRYGFLCERVEGPSLMDLVARKPWRYRKYARLLAQLQRKMHRLEGGEELPSQYDRLERKIRSATNLPAGLRRAALGTLKDLPRGDRLCHGDFHPGNVLMEGGQPVLIDWNDATRGNPWADFARSLLVMEKGRPPEEVAPYEKWIISLLKRLFQRAYRGDYLKLGRGEVDREAIEEWKTVNAAARLSENVPEGQELLLFLERKLCEK